MWEGLSLVCVGLVESVGDAGWEDGYRATRLVVYGIHGSGASCGRPVSSLHGASHLLCMDRWGGVGRVGIQVRSRREDADIGMC